MFWIILSVLLWGLLHSLLASSRCKDLARRTFGDGIQRTYRLVYNLFACLSFLPVLALLFLLPDHTLYTVPFPWAGLMLLGEALAMAALLVGLMQSRPLDFLGLRQLARSEEKPGQLKTDGLYRYVRHPLYTAGIAILWLMPLMTANALGVNIALTVYVVFGAILEERRLKTELGQVYRNYMKVTPMFIPFLVRNKTR